MADKPPHDQLFKRTFGDPTHAIGELAAVLPPTLVEKIDWSTLQRAPGSFVDEALRERHTDLLYRVELASGKEVVIYVLLEAQRTVDSLMPMRMLIYLARFWDNWRRTTESPKHPPPVIPVVLYHGDKQWHRSTEFLDLFDLDETMAELLAPYLPKFRFALDDLTVESDEALRQRALSDWASVVLGALKHSRSESIVEDFLRPWQPWLERLMTSRDGLANLETLSYYVLIVNRTIVPEELGAFMQEHLGAEAKDAALTAGERLIQEGLQRGRVEGRAEEAGRAVLAVFEARNLAVPDDVRKRILECTDITTLERWLQRAVVVESIADLFEG